MTKKLRRRHVAEHRRRYRAMGLARVEVQVPQADAGLVRKLAQRLRANDPRAEKLRAELAASVATEQTAKSMFEALACDLPDEAFEPMLQRDRGPPRDVDL